MIIADKKDLLISIIEKLFQLNKNKKKKVITNN